MWVLIFGLIFWVAPVFVGHKIGAPKNRAGWAWGLLLGWLGVVIVGCLGPGTATGHQSFHLTSSAPGYAAPQFPPPVIPPPQAVPAGWYTDPQMAGRLRYWDGAAWTEYSSALDTAGAAAPTL
jgi:Protein of unknown function (DUF2510)